jgi:hypothetical protein
MEGDTRSLAARVADALEVAPRGLAGNPGDAMAMAMFGRVSGSQGGVARLSSSSSSSSPSISRSSSSSSLGGGESDDSDSVNWLEDSSGGDESDSESSGDDRWRVSPGKAEEEGPLADLDAGPDMFALDDPPPPVNMEHVRNPELISPAEAVALSVRLRCCIASREDDDGAERLMISAARRGHPIAIAVSTWFGYDDEFFYKRLVQARRKPGVENKRLTVEQNNRLVQRQSWARRQMKKRANSPPCDDPEEEQMRIDAIVRLSPVFSPPRGVFFLHPAVLC